MIQKCKKCGNWIAAPFEEKNFDRDGIFGVFSNKILGNKDKSAQFWCPCCGNDWVETNSSNDQSALCRAAGGKVINSDFDKYMDINYPNRYDSSSMISDDTKDTVKHMAKHAALHALKGLLGG